MIPKQIIEDIVNKADLVSIVGERIQLVKKGRNYWAVCPFHQDSNPSMSVSNEKHIYKCFSCQVSGNVIDFIQNYDNISFQKAIEKVAESISFDISQYALSHKSNKESSLDKIYRINKDTMSFFKSGLATNEGKIAIDYLKKRNISFEQIEKFEIGYISSKSNLVQHLIDKGFNPKELLDAGLANYNENKKDLTNVFKDRLIFAIKDENNNIIGFSGRKLESKSDRPKYLNTRETEIFSKRKIAYNFFNAVKSMRVKKEIIVLEGYMDVISLDRVGIDNVIAIMGTSLSSFHTNLFKSVKDCEVKMFLDGDQAGINANIKASALLISSKIKTSIVHNTTNKDPDELINDNKKDYVLEIIKHSINPLEYIVKQLWKNTNQDDFDSLTKFIEQIADFVLKTNNQIIYEKSIKDIQEITKLSSSSIVRIFKDKANYIKNNLQVNDDKNLQQKKIVEYNPVLIENKIKAYNASELAILQDLLKSSRHVDYILDQIYEVNLLNSNYRQLINQIISIYKQNANIETLELISKLKISNTPSLKSIIEKLESSIEFTVEYKDPKKRLSDAFDKLRERNNEKDIQEIEKLINDAKTGEKEKKKFRILLSKKIKRREFFKRKFSNK